MMFTEREKCWITHKRRRFWNACQLCGQPIKWVRLLDGTFSPCNEEPALYAFSEKGKFKIVSKGELLKNITLNVPVSGKLRYGHLPHYYTCPVLVKERREWARANKGW